MSSNAPRSLGAAVAVIAATLFLWLLDLAGILAPFDGVIYDSGVRLLPAPASSPAVLLLDWTPPDDPDAYRQALAELSALGPRQIVFTFLPHDAPAEFFRDAARLDVLFGRSIFAPLPNAAVGQEPATAVILLPMVERGVARRQRSWVVLDGMPAPLLEAEVVRRLRPNEAIPDEFGIRFRSGLPRVPSQALLGRELVPELVRDRVVLVGQPPPAGTPGIWTPTSTTQPMSLLEFHGQAIDSLMGRQSIRPLAPGWRLALAALVALACFLVFQRFGVRAVWAGAVLLAVTSCGGLLALWYGCWPGVLVLLLTQAMCWLVLSCERALHSSAVLRRLLLELTAQDRQWDRPTNFLDSPEPWELLARLAAQSLEVTRQGFLEVVPGTNRLREVAGRLGSCELAARLGLDSSASHYRAAIEARGPIFPFDAAGEVVALVPLRFADQLFGFWLVGVKANRTDNDLRGQFSGYADQIAHLLWQRGQSRAERESAHLARFLGPGDGYGQNRSLGSVLDRMTLRLGRAERLLGMASRPALVSDAFGRIHEVNHPMREWLAERGSDARHLPVVDWVAAVTNQPAESVRRLMRGVFRDHQRIALPVPDSVAGKHYLMHLHPLTGLSAAGEPVPFGLDGLLCELVDVTAQARLDVLREKLVGHLALTVRNDLAAVELAAGMLASAECGDEERVLLGEIVTDKVRKVSATFTEAQSGFDAPFADDARFPVDSASALDEALAALDGRVDLLRPEVLPLVLAAPEPLRKTFAAVLGFLARDTRPGSPIRVRVEQTDQWVRYTFASNGFGLPPDRFEQLIAPTGAVKADEFAALRDGLRRVRGWSGLVEADSVVGRGVTVALSLPMFA